MTPFRVTTVVPPDEWRMLATPGLVLRAIVRSVAVVPFTWRAPPVVVRPRTMSVPPAPTVLPVPRALGRPRLPRALAAADRMIRPFWIWIGPAKSLAVPPIVQTDAPVLVMRDTA